MKTFDQLYKERRKWLDSQNIQDWTYLDTQWVAERYAEQAIERCAEKVHWNIKNNSLFTTNGAAKKSILKVKQELK